jgi:hypothetical protein
MRFDATQNAANVALILAALAAFSDPAIQVELVGTQYTHGEGNDYDYVVLVSDRAVAQADLHDAGFIITGQESGNEDDFTTLRRGAINVMLTEEDEFLREFKVAAEVCKYVQQQMLALDPSDIREMQLNKVQRIKLHRIIMNGEVVE